MRYHNTPPRARAVVATSANTRVFLCLPANSLYKRRIRLLQPHGRELQRPQRVIEKARVVRRLACAPQEYLPGAVSAKQKNRADQLVLFFVFVAFRGEGAVSPQYK